MRILVVTNLYPPRHVGGYELACADVVAQLSSRGVATEVVTSWRGFGGARVAYGARRLLRVQNAFDSPYTNATHELAWNLWNRSALRRSVDRFSPDAILAFNLSGLGPPLLEWLGSQPIPVVHDVSDKALLLYRPGSFRWPALPFPHSAARAALLRFAGVPTGGFHVDLRDSYFRSEFLRRTFREAGFDVDRAPVIHHGIVLPSELPPMEERSPSVLFAGRICEEKGPHVLLEALQKLKGRAYSPRKQVPVILAGPKTGEGGYLRRLEKSARLADAAFAVRFPGPLAREELAKLMVHQTIFAFPVLCEEGFSIALLEAMAAGLAVVSTSTGGSAELLRHGENALVVPPGDAAALAASLEQLLQNEGLRVRLAKEARRTAERFRLDRAIDRIETHLRNVVSAHAGRQLPALANSRATLR